eukprot:CAMPEP_0114278110 /NCGR_PEP_ID=MMETSP0059-20121206/1160_1 /TAXON_ID=36894 /ORGANISM="Pyramimonas parkeae, Strain CCMP726" /LENGTH=878 /DNA_ID=CAMNT_0001398283 /DNA_START=370 /DNA_END=3007 /DNA_ORIENTATION=-
MDPARASARLFLSSFHLMRPVVITGGAAGVRHRVRRVLLLTFLAHRLKADTLPASTSHPPDAALRAPSRSALRGGLGSAPHPFFQGYAEQAECSGRSALSRGMVARCFSSSAGGVDLPDSGGARPSGRDDEHAVEWEVEAQRGVASSCQADHGTKVASEGPAIPRECRKLTCAGVERLYNTVEIAAVKGVVAALEMQGVHAWADPVEGPRSLGLVLHELKKRRAGRVALEALKWCGRKEVPTNAMHFVTAMSACAHEGLWEEAWELFHLMDVQGVPRNVMVYNTMIAAFGKAAQWHRALDLLDEMEGASNKDLQKEESAPVPKPNLRTYSAVISGLQTQGQWQLALKTLHRMQAAGIPPDVVLYSSVVASLEKDGQWETALEVYRAMTAHGIKPNTHTYSSLISALAKAHQLDLVKETFALMMSEGVPANSYTYNSMLMACVRPGRWEEALAVYAKMSQDGIVADQYTFSALFASLESSHEWARAAKLVHEMHARGVVGAPRMYHRAVAPLAEAQHWESAVSAWEALLRAGGAVEDARTFQGALHAYEGLGRAWRAYLLWEEMHRRKLQPPPEPLSRETLRAVFQECGLDWACAARVHHALAAAGEAEAASYAATMRACAAANKPEAFEASMAVFHDMLSAGVAPERAACASMLAAAVRRRRGKEAMLVLETMAHAELPPAQPQLAAFLLWLWKSGRRGDAARAWLLARRAGHRADDDLEVTPNGVELNLILSQTVHVATMRTLLWLLSYRREILASHKARSCMPPQSMVTIITNRGKQIPVNGASEVLNSVAATLERLHSPFLVDKERPGCLTAVVGDVEEWLCSVSETDLVGEPTTMDDWHLKTDGLGLQIHPAPSSSLSFSQVGAHAHGEALIPS